MLIQISSGQSPKECERAVYLYHKELLREFPSLEVVSINGDKECAKTVVLYTEEDLSFLDGTVQWICKSPFRPNHQRKNWFIDISILKEEFRFDKLNDVKFEVCRASGAGGQHVNKTNSAVKATHSPTGISAISMDERSQIQNKKKAYIRLMNKIEETGSSINNVIQYENWNEINQLVRGNPNRVYKGEEFKRLVK